MQRRVPEESTSRKHTNLTNNIYKIEIIKEKNGTHGISLVFKAYNSERLHRMLII